MFKWHVCSKPAWTCLGCQAFQRGACSCSAHAHVTRPCWHVSMACLFHTGKEHGSLPELLWQTLFLDPIALHFLNLETSATRLARVLLVNIICLSTCLLVYCMYQCILYTYVPMFYVSLCLSGLIWSGLVWSGLVYLIICLSVYLSII